MNKKNEVKAGNSKSEIVVAVSGGF